jgi:hypothetical protein
MRLLGAHPLPEAACELSFETGGTRHVLVARRVGRAPLVGGFVGTFEPETVFRDLPLTAHQVRTLTRMAVEVHEGASFAFPIDVPAAPSASPAGSPDDGS